MEANALRCMMRATHGDVGFIESGAEPLQFVHRPDGGRIAVSDYGPASGKPVLVLHSATTTRPISRCLLRALHAAGYRPISVDRPGFGLSDDVSPAERRLDRYVASAGDVVRVLDRLKLRTVDVVARGIAQAPALQSVAADRLGRVVVVNPGLPGGRDRRRSGLFGRLKDLYARDPRMIRFMIRAVAQQTNFERFTRMTQRWFQDSSADAAAARRPEVVRDYFMGIRMFATGRLSGYVAEQIHQMRADRHERLPGTHGWCVLMAAHDVLYDPEQALAYWRDILPDARFRVVEDAGRWLAMSHPHYVVQALEERATEA